MLIESRCRCDEELELAPDASAPKAARDWIERRLGPDVDDAKLATAKLLVSELVSNAVLHGQGRITLRAALGHGRLLAEVIDEGHGFSWIGRKPDLGLAGGWGLPMVDRESDGWGIYEGTTHVWFELSL